MKWRTSVSTKRDGEVWVRGTSLVELIESASFTEAIYLMIQGKKPEPAHKEMLDAILVSCIEHGVEVPSAFVPRVVASTGNSMNAALAAGLLSIGDYHGGAIENVMKMIASGAAPGDKIPGLGHKIYKDVDPRAELLFKKSAQLGIAGAGVDFIRNAKKRFEETHPGKHLPINVDGAIGAILSDMSFDWRVGKAIFILGRLPGMIAHTHEEMMNEKPFRRFEESDVEHIGLA